MDRDDEKPGSHWLKKESCKGNWRFNGVDDEVVITAREMFSITAKGVNTGETYEFHPPFEFFGIYVPASKE